MIQRINRNKKQRIKSKILSKTPRICKRIKFNKRRKRRKSRNKTQIYNQTMSKIKNERKLKFWKMMINLWNRSQFRKRKMSKTLHKLNEIILKWEMRRLIFNKSCDLFMRHQEREVWKISHYLQSTCQDMIKQIRILLRIIEIENDLLW